MATQKKAKPEIDPNKSYTISLSAPVEIAPHSWARPGDRVQVSGVRLAEIEDKVESYTEV